MAKKRYALFHLIFLLALIVITVNVSQQLYSDSVQDFNDDMNLQGEKTWELPNNGSGRPLPREDEDPVILGNSSEGILYFIQITDIHVSKFRPDVGLRHLQHFLTSVVPVVKPEFIIATGDLTDAKTPEKLRSRQYQEEWQMYRATLEASGVIDKKDYWFDLRGNHDCFNVPDWEHALNYYSRYGVTQKEGFAHTFERPFGSYRFVSIDGCPKFGTSRQFNFFGYVGRNEMDRLETQLVRMVPSNHTFLLSHYPVATTQFGKSSSGLSFPELANYVSVYFCGHLHELAYGIGEDLKAYHPFHFLELELSDMKQHASYRIFAVDNDLVTFIDAHVPLPPIKDSPPLVTIPTSHQQLPDLVPQSPIVLITNPKNHRYLLPKHEPIHRIIKSTHVRMLIFNSSELTSVTVTIDGEARLAEPSQSEVPLWVAAWAPSEYDDGLDHSIKVSATDITGATGWHNVTFNLNATVPSTSGSMGETILLSDIDSIVRHLFVTAYLLIMGVGLLLPRLHVLYLQMQGRLVSTTQLYYTCIQAIKAQIAEPDCLKGSTWVLALTRLLFLRICFNLHVLATSTWLFYPNFLYGLSLITLPLFYGGVDPSLPWLFDTPDLFDYSAQFDHSVYVYGFNFPERSPAVWMPLLDTYLFTAIELIFGLSPFLIYIMWNLVPSNNSVLGWSKWFASHGIILFVSIYQLLPFIVLNLYYGLASPPRIIYIIYQIIVVFRLYPKSWKPSKTLFKFASKPQAPAEPLPPKHVE